MTSLPWGQITDQLTAQLSTRAIGKVHDYSKPEVLPNQAIAHNEKAADIPGHPPVDNVTHLTHHNMTKHTILGRCCCGAASCRGFLGQASQFAEDDPFAAWDDTDVACAVGTLSVCPPPSCAACLVSLLHSYGRGKRIRVAWHPLPGSPAQPASDSSAQHNFVAGICHTQHKVVL